LTYVVNMPIY